MNEKRSWFNLVGKAFLEPLNYGTLTVFALLSGLIGHWTPLVFAFSAELVYLGIAPGLPFFKNRALQEFSQKKEEEFNLKLQKFRIQLKPDSLIKAENLDKIRIKIQESGFSNSSEKINAVFLSYLKFLALKDQYQDYSPDSELGKIEQEKQNLLNQENSAASFEEKQAIQENIELLKKRQEHLQNIQNIDKQLGMRLAQIENTMQLVLDQTLESKAGADVSGSLNSLLAQVDATEEVARETGGSMLQNLDLGKRS